MIIFLNESCLSLSGQYISCLGVEYKALRIMCIGIQALTVKSQNARGEFYHSSSGTILLLTCLFGGLGRAE